MEQFLKLVLHDWDRVVSVLFLLILLLAKTNSFLEKKHGKKNLIRVFSFSNGKIILTILTEVVTFYIKFTAIHVERIGF